MLIHWRVSEREHPKSAISYTFWNDCYNSSALPCRLWYNFHQLTHQIDRKAKYTEFAEHDKPSIFPELESVQKCNVITATVACQTLVHPVQSTTVHRRYKWFWESGTGSNCAHSITTAASQTHTLSLLHLILLTITSYCLVFPHGLE